MHSRTMIGNEFLINSYLTPEMEVYFYKKLKREHPSYVKLKIIEFLKFILLSHHTYGDIPFNAEIDEVWHLWILQTIQYAELMDKLPTQKFIHHCSTDYPDRDSDLIESEEVKLQKQLSYLVSYWANFGDFTQETLNFWPTANLVMNAFNFNLKQLNYFLRETSFESEGFKRN